MKRFALALIPALLSTSVLADYGDTAQVISAVPIAGTNAAPRQECWTEQVPTYAPAAVAQVAPAPVSQQRYVQPAAAPATGTGFGALAGAIIGGIVGHQFGNSSGGRDHSSVAGAVVGGLIGNGIESSTAAAVNSQPRYAQGVQPSYAPAPQAAAVAPQQTGTRSVERCRMVSDTRSQVSGYNVTYRYNNQEYTTQLPYDPGRTMRVRILVSPEVTR